MEHSGEQIGGSRSWRRRRLLIALIAIVPLIPIVVAVLAISSGGGASHKAATFTPVHTGAPVARPSAQKTSIPSGALVALVRHPTTMRTAPGGRVIAPISTRTEFGSPDAVLVVRHAPGWLGVISPLAGNGHVGWIPRPAAALTRVLWELKVSLGARRLTVIDRGRIVKRYTVAIGQPAAPTPTGRFAVTDRLLTGDPSGPYGCCILALSAHSPRAIQGWTGGDRIAIHSTPDTSTIGEPVSHGCLRLTMAEGRWLMGHIPLGTPTLISS